MCDFDKKNLQLRMELLENQVVELSSRVVTLTEIVRSGHSDNDTQTSFTKILGTRLVSKLIEIIKRNSFAYYFLRKIYNLNLRKFMRNGY